MTEKHTRKFLAAAILAAGSAWGPIAGAHAQAAQPQYPVPGANYPNSPQLKIPTLPTPTPITDKGVVVEDVIARVNDQIITRSELERSERQLLQEAQQNNVPAADLEQRQHDLLRDMIDQQLLLSKGKELGITGDAETLRRLDEIRKQNHLDSMDALEKAAGQQGVSFEDFKAGIRNNIITQQVVRDEVGRTVSRGMTKTAEQAFYDAHRKDFEQPEQVHLSEILVPTPENPSDAAVNQAQAKAEDIAAKLKAGLAFPDAAKQFSGGPSASQGGELGDFKRGALAKVLEDATFALPAGGITAPIRTRQGFVILRTDSHTAAGVPPLATVEPQIQEAMYLDALQPALRVFLTKARQEAYVDIKPGFVDSGSTRKENKPVFTAYTPPPVKKKTEAKRRLEQQKDAAAQQKLAEARQNAAAKAAAKAAKSGGLTNVATPVKVKKVRREKVRFGQAPRNALPTALGSTETVQTGEALAGQAPGVAMAGADSTSTVITTGTGVDTDGDPLAPKAGPQKKTRYTARQADIELAKATDKAVKAKDHIAARPAGASTEEKANEKEQAAPLGLNGDTVKKQPKPKRKKGDPKERLQERPKPVDTVTPVAPTVNPTLGATGVQSDAKTATTPTSDQTTLPADTAPPGQVNPPPATTQPKS